MSEHTQTQAPENLVDLMNKLVSPQEPEPISLVPQTWGWLALLVLVGLTVFVVQRGVRSRYRANAYRRLALAEVSKIEADPTALARLLRKTALAAFPRRKVAGLSGADWLTFLDETCEGARFRSGPGAFVATAPYVPGMDVSRADVEAVRHWIAHHKVEPRP